MKMDDQLRSLLRLIQRSEKNADDDGWIKVSCVCWPLLTGAPAELIELRDDQHCRLTDAGRIVLAWM